MKKILFTLFLLFSVFSILDAECLDNDLLEYMRNVKVKYDLIDDASLDGDYILYLEPKRDDIEFKATNTLFSGESSSMDIKGGYHGIISRVHFKEKEYHINIYVKKTAKNCAGEFLRSINYSVPRYNPYSKTQYCVDHPKLDVCKTMSDYGNLSNEEFYKVIGSTETPPIESIWIIILKYSLWALIPALIIGSIYYIKIKKVKKVKENA